MGDRTEAEARAQHLRAMFDPALDPVLAPGFVSTEFKADAAQQAAARAKLAERVAHWHWRKAELGEARRVVAGCLGESDEVFDARIAGAAMRPLPFFEDGWLFHLPGPDPDDAAAAERVFVYRAGGALAGQRLTGQSLPMHMANEAAPLRLDDANIEEYLLFFCSHLAGADGLFYLIEHDAPPAVEPYPELVVAATDQRDPQLARALDPEGRFGPYLRAQLAQPITRISPPGSQAVFIATLRYGNDAVRGAFLIQPGGQVEMLRDTGIENAAMREVGHGWLPKPPQPPSPAPEADGAPEDEGGAA